VILSFWNEDYRFVVVDLINQSPGLPILSCLVLISVQIYSL